MSNYVIEAENKYRIAGIVDKKEFIGEKVMGYPLIASDDDLPMLCKEYAYFHITVGQIKSGIVRQSLFNLVKEMGGSFPVIISPNAYTSKHANIGDGTIIMHHAFINAMCKVGENCIVNTSAVVEHDVVIGNHCHISTGAFINGGAEIHEGSFIGSNATVVQSVKVADHSVLAAGSVLLKDTEPFSLYAGSPATLRKNYNGK